jgi:acyl carrier protein
MTLSREQLVAQVNNIFVDLFEIETDSLSPEANLYTDLKMDSIDAIDLVISFERMFELKVDPSELKSIRTLHDIHELACKYYNQRLAS